MSHYIAIGICHWDDLLDTYDEEEFYIFTDAMQGITEFQLLKVNEDKRKDYEVLKNDTVSLYSFPTNNNGAIVVSSLFPTVSSFEIVKDKFVEVQ